MVDNQPKCEPYKMSCKDFPCPMGAICRMVDNQPKCELNPLSCKDFPCPMGTICRMVDNQPKCEPYQMSCKDFPCPMGTICRMVDNQPKCEPYKLSCKDFPCPMGAICRMVDNQPKCEPYKMSCKDFPCPMGAICRMVDNQPKCEPHKLSCNDIHCPKGETCKLTEGDSPRCVPTHHPPLVCHVLRQWRYRAFDGRGYSLGGPCSQTLVSTCGARKTFLNVTVGGQDGAGPAASFAYVMLQGDGYEVVLLRGEEKMARVSGSVVPLPLLMVGGRVRVERRGGQRRVELPPGVRVAIGGDGAVTVTVPAELREELCGICAHPESGAGKCAPSCSSKSPPASCAPVPNPVPNRPPPSNSSCSALGVGHVRTFDLLHHDFSGSCLRLLVEECSGTKTNPFFRILIRSGSGGIVGVVIQWQRMVVEMEEEKVTLHGAPITLPYTAKHSALTVERRGWEVELRTPWGLRVAYDGQHGRVSVQVESSYAGRLCGLCGDFDGDPRNDLAPARGWRVGEEEGCEDGSGCGEEEGKKGAQSEECGVLLDKDGPFRLCHEAVHPETYYRDCMADRCHDDGVCRVVAAYVAACQEVGKEVLEWRSEGFC
ncbi:IgGFc-binding protein-like, partial [Lagopus leucura]|uniref:IgGFc-binding protein-like n=1 Tax=Lagopus leucura TaxID=30410 RepID=UPI001C67EF0C